MSYPPNPNLEYNEAHYRRMYGANISNQEQPQQDQWKEPQQDQWREPQQDQLREPQQDQLREPQQDQLREPQQEFVPDPSTSTQRMQPTNKPYQSKGYYPQKGYSNYRYPEQRTSRPHELNYHAYTEEELRNQFTHNPIVSDVALMYGAKIVDTGKQIVGNEVTKYVSSLRDYFAVDTSYVIKKLKLVLFPYHNKSWIPKFVDGRHGVPKDDVNAADLYLPVMGYVTYMLLAGIMLGVRSQFDPETLSAWASKVLVIIIMELVAQLIVMYILQLESMLKFWDLLAFLGYKFLSANTILLLNLIFRDTGYYYALIYCGSSLAFFLLRSIKWRLETVGNYNSMQEATPEIPHHRKRKIYFLLFISISQPLWVWWLTTNFEK